LYVHIDYRLVHYVYCLLGECFGLEAFKNDIVWSYGGRGAKSISGQFPRNHDVLLIFAKGEPTYNRVYKEVLYDISSLPSHIKLDADGMPFKTSPRGDYTDASVARLESEGRIYLTRNGSIRVKYYLERRGNQVVEKNLIGDVWDDIPDMMHAPRDERLDFPTQKPEKLLERVIEAASNPGNLVADFFCGSGTTLAVAEKLGRRWIGCDLSRWAIHVTRKRLLDIPDCKPFEVLNLGKYERQYWQGVTFGDKKDKSVTEQKLYEYLAFILKLYGAQPVGGMAHLHGKKGKAMVHIGAVDAPVTIDEVNQALDECVALKQTELHVLGWEWEMGLAGPNNDVRKGSLMHEIARQKGVKLLLLQIPREVMEQQAAEKGDVRFFELAYFEVNISKPERLAVQVELKNFATPNVDLIPKDVRSKIKKWSDYIDYWAVDWDFHNDTFMQGWVAYRTRKERKLPLTSDLHRYETPGKYRILVKVIDIFGNDTSQAFDVDVE
jgi:adenine-specific DNA-methyltransferase